MFPVEYHISFQSIIEDQGLVFLSFKELQSYFLRIAGIKNYIKLVAFSGESFHADGGVLNNLFRTDDLVLAVILNLSDRILVEMTVLVRKLSGQGI